MVILNRASSNSSNMLRKPGHYLIEVGAHVCVFADAPAYPEPGTQLLKSEELVLPCVARISPSNSSQRGRP